MLALSSVFLYLKRAKVNFVGQIGGQELRDMVFYDASDYPAGPFPNLAAFHDRFARLPYRNSPENFSRKNPAFFGLNDDEPLRFTHGDLDRSNILISCAKDGPPRVVAIVDWHQSGWYPRHWEFMKASWTADVYEDWSLKYMPQFLEPPSFLYYRSFEWIRMRCC